MGNLQCWLYFYFSSKKETMEVPPKVILTRKWCKQILSLHITWDWNRTQTAAISFELLLLSLPAPEWQSWDLCYIGHTSRKSLSFSRTENTCILFMLMFSKGLFPRGCSNWLQNCCEMSRGFLGSEYHCFLLLSLPRVLIFLVELLFPSCPFPSFWDCRVLHQLVLSVTFIFRVNP